MPDIYSLFRMFNKYYPDRYPDKLSLFFKFIRLKTKIVYCLKFNLDPSIPKKHIEYFPLHSMTPLLLYDTIYFHTSVPEVPQLPSENRMVQNPPALRITVAFLIKTEEEIK